MSCASARAIRRAAVFLAFASGGSWLLLDLFLLAGGELSLVRPAGIALGLGYMLVPGLSAVILLRYAWKEPLLPGLGLRLGLNVWFLIAWLAPAALQFAALGAALALPGVRLSPDMSGFVGRFRGVIPVETLAELERQVREAPLHPVWLVLIQGLAFGGTVNAAAALGEELGWRGLLQRELAPFGFWGSSALVGACWGLWHAPLVLLGLNYPEHPLAGVPMMIAWCVLLSPLLAYARLKSGSVLAAALMHGTLNGTAGISFMLLDGGSDLTVGLTGLAGLAVLAVADAGLFLIGRPRLPSGPGTTREARPWTDPDSGAGELLEVVDDEGRVTGLAPRERCHGDPALAHRVVHVLVRNRAGALFLQRRSRTRRIQPGKWDSSVGGHVLPGEPLEAAALRELAEELGLEAAPGELERLHEYVWRSDIETERVTTFAIVREGPFRLHPDEIEEGRFWTEAELRAAAGTGALTPNLEEELARVGLLPRN